MAVCPIAQARLDFAETGTVAILFRTREQEWTTYANCYPASS